MKEVIAKINEVVAALQADLAKAAERKAALEIMKDMKEFRKASIAELK